MARVEYFYFTIFHKKTGLPPLMDRVPLGDISICSKRENYNCNNSKKCTEHLGRSLQVGSLYMRQRNGLVASVRLDSLASIRLPTKRVIKHEVIDHRYI